MALTTLDISLIVVYTLIVLGIGFWSARRQKGSGYLLAERKLSTWSLMATIVASYIGGGAIVAYTAYVYQFGISAIMVYVGVAIGLLAFIWYGLRIRRVGKKKGFHTLSDWMYDKFNKKVGLLSAIVILIAYFGLLTNQFIAGTSILSGISGWSYELSLLFSGLVILVYLVLGGFKSVVKTDVFQYLIFLVLLFVLGFVMLNQGQRTILPELLDPAGLGLTLSIAFVIYGIFTILVGPEFWQRIYAAKNDKVVKHGLIGAAILIIVTGFALSLIGLVAGSVAPGLNPNQAVVYGLTNLLPIGFLGLGLVLVFAAIMSSADTLIFVLSLSISKDYFGHLFHKNLNDNQLRKLTRTFVIVVSLLGIIFAFFFRDIVQVILTVGGVILALAPAVLSSFHWNIKPGAAFASLLSGPIYVAILIITGNLIPELAAASIIVAAVVLVIFQFALKNKNN